MSRAADVRVVKSGPDAGVYIDGFKIPGVLKIEPDLHGRDSLAVAVITVHVGRYAFEESAPAPPAP